MKLEIFYYYYPRSAQEILIIVIKITRGKSPYFEWNMKLLYLIIHLVQHMFYFNNLFDLVTNSFSSNYLSIIKIQSLFITNYIVFEFNFHIMVLYYKFLIYNNILYNNKKIE